MRTGSILSKRKKKGFLSTVGFEKNKRIDKSKERPVALYERELTHTKRKRLIQRAEVTLRSDKFPYGKVMIINAGGKEVARIGFIEKVIPKIGKICDIW